MKRKSEMAVWIAAFPLTLLFALPALAQNAAGSQGPPPNTGSRAAMRMVPAQAALSRNLEAKKDRIGEMFSATLADTVHLKNGPELPRGTKLMGRIVNDDMNVKGMSKFALRFTSAKLKDGKVIPIKATIVGIFSPASIGPEGYPVVPGNQSPNSWTDQTLQVDQIGVLRGVDLHSRISSANSGVLVSTTDDDMKLSLGTEFALAIAERK